MKFDVFDAIMRVFETEQDHSVLPGIHMVARIDGRNFTRLTKELHTFETPFDERFRDHMIATAEHLMGCGFQVLYGYTQSDEISLLFHRDTTVFDRKLRKYLSILAAEASATFSLLLGGPAAFDCRIAQLPSVTRVRDYFLWRNEDARRNALNAHCYWMLRKEGKSIAEATDAMHKLTVSAKNELLVSRGINYNDLPAWQKRGIGLAWDGDASEETSPATPRRINRLMELPMRESYGAFIEDIVTRSLAGSGADYLE